MEDEPGFINRWLLEISIVAVVGVMTTWSWVVRNVLMKRLSTVEERVGQLEAGFVTHAEVEKLKTDLFAKIERTEDKIEGAHDRMLGQLNQMVDLLSKH